MHLRNLFLQHLAQTSESPLMLEIEKAEGMYLYDTQGKKYMDLIAGIAVSNLGHCHPNIIKAINEQTQKYMHVLVYGEMVHSPQVLLAQKITELLPKHQDNNKNLESVYFVNSGTEAIEVAMKLAKRSTGRQEIISCYEAYHGSTQGALSIGGGEHYKQNYRPLLPETNQIWYGSFSDLEKITKKTACVIIEVVQGEAGVKIACKNYFEALRKKCDEVGALLVFDEVQTGFGRTGKMFAMEHLYNSENQNILPDMVTFAKGLGAGLPIGAVVSTQKIMSVLKNNPILGHITTFGGNPVCCASALANINTLLEKDENGKTLVELAEEKGLLFRKYLQSPLTPKGGRLGENSKIRAVRQIGLMMAVQFDDFLQMKNIIDKLIAKGFLTDWFLYCDNAMRLAPPLIITEEQIKEACEAIISV